MHPSRFISAVAYLFGFFILEKVYKNHRYTYLRFYQCFAILSSILSFLQGLDVIFSPFSFYPGVNSGFKMGLFYYISLFFNYPALFIAIYFTDTGSRDSVDSKKLIFATFLSITLFLSEFHRIIFTINVLFIALLMIKFQVALFLKSPPSLKRKMMINLIAWVAFYGIFFIYNSIGSYVEGFWGNNFVEIPYDSLKGLLFLITTYMLRDEPRLGFILPFKALRLVVLDTRSGIPLFTHTWKAGKKLANQDLFSSMIQGITLIMKEAINEGDVEEISLRSAKVIFVKKEKHELGFAIVCTKSSKTLRVGLEFFANEFVKEYGSGLGDGSNPIVYEVGQFDSATKLLDKCLPFIPDFD
ncbi:MAG: hypothetical protein ACFFCS_07480 [Candidatus Hodarchaeota archaeon]